LEADVTRTYWLVLGILATWRITHLLHAEDGPWDVLFRLRRRVGNSVLGSIMDCFYCMSLWVAAPLAFWLGETWKERLLLWPAISGGAALLERLTTKASADAPPATTYYEESEDEADELLRK
jgi:hypothetical protein